MTMKIYGFFNLRCAYTDLDFGCILAIKFDINKENNRLKLNGGCR